MKNRKSAFWLAVWVILLFVAAAVELCFIIASEQRSILLQSGLPLNVSQFTARQIVPVLLMNLFCLLPPLGMSCYNAIKEKDKVLTGTTAFLFVFHVIGEISILVQFLG